MNTEATAAEERLGQEIEALDREAREALDKLADKREELESRHRATGLAAERQREREEERRRREAEEAEKKTREEARARREQIGEETGEIAAEVAGMAESILERIEKLEELDALLIEEVARYDTEAGNRLASQLPGNRRRWLRERFGA